MSLISTAKETPLTAYREQGPGTVRTWSNVCYGVARDVGLNAAAKRDLESFLLGAFDDLSLPKRRLFGVLTMHQRRSNEDLA